MYAAKKDKYLLMLTSHVKTKICSYKQQDILKNKFEEEAMLIQGSGWVYLSDKGEIKIIKNHEVRNDILLLIDWWEHAWALDYQADKKSYLKNIWKIIDWRIINGVLGQSN